MLLICALCLGSAQAGATDYSDIWYESTNSGWSVNLVQNGTFIFAVLHVYGTDGMPVWYTAQLSLNLSDGSFGGPLYTSTGPYYGSTSSSQVTTTQVGSAIFRPADAFGEITYSVGDVVVSKNIQRQTLQPIPLTGTYRGGTVVNVTQCTDPNQNATAGHFVHLAVSQSSPSEAMFVFQDESGLTCKVEGSLTQFGTLSRVDGSYTCTSGINTTATLYDVKVTSQGIDGSLAADNIGGNCLETTHFSTVSE